MIRIIMRGNCSTLAQEFYSFELKNLVATMDFIAEVPRRNESVTAQLSEDIFSRMVYENICPGEDVQHLAWKLVAYA